MSSVCGVPFWTGVNTKVTKSQFQGHEELQNNFSREKFEKISP
jgi:hypothetical protein